MRARRWIPALLKPMISAGLLAAVSAAPVSAETVASPDLGRAAASAFKDTCLATRGKGKDAAIFAISARPGIVEGQSLPAYGGGEPMRTFKEGSIEYLVRASKKGRYGCFVVIEGEAGQAESVKATIDTFDGVQAKPAKVGKKGAYTWSFADSKDEVRLIPNSDVGGILINLEVN